VLGRGYFTQKRSTEVDRAGRRWRLAVKASVGGPVMSTQNGVIAMQYTRKSITMGLFKVKSKEHLK
jgi:hypothetical protein